jgi:hypothetical protein
MRTPFLGAFHALAVDDRWSGTPCQFAGLQIERVMDAKQRKEGLRNHRNVLRQLAPLVADCKQVEMAFRIEDRLPASANTYIRLATFAFKGQMVRVCQTVLASWCHLRTIPNKSTKRSILRNWGPDVPLK